MCGFFFFFHPGGFWLGDGLLRARVGGHFPFRRCVCCRPRRSMVRESDCTFGHLLAEGEEREREGGSGGHVSFFYFWPVVGLEKGR